jgi:hypothetical protein
MDRDPGAIIVQRPTAAFDVRAMFLGDGHSPYILNALFTCIGMTFLGLVFASA